MIDPVLEQLHFPGKHDQKRHGRRRGSGGSVIVDDGLDREAATASAESLRNQASTKMSELSGSFSPEHQDVYSAWSGYVGGGSQSINGAARGNRETSELISSDIRNLDAAFEPRNAGVRNQNVALLYRGVNPQRGADLRRDLSPGDVVVDRGFTSTTTDASVANTFAQNGGVRLDIRVPGGQRVISGDASENEVILPRSTSMRYLGDSLSGEMQFEVVT